MNDRLGLNGDASVEGRLPRDLPSVTGAEPCRQSRPLKRPDARRVSYQPRTPSRRQPPHNDLVAHIVLRFVIVPARVVRARLDDAAEQGLATLLREGRNESEAVRTALVEAGQRRMRAGDLAAEVRRLADDTADTAEREAVMLDMESVSADWPE